MVSGSESELPKVFDISAEDTVHDLYGLHDFAEDIRNVTVAFMRLSDSLDDTELEADLFGDVSFDNNTDMSEDLNTVGEDIIDP